MALIDGYVRGRPARIADNLVRLYPEVYSVDPPASDDAPQTNDAPSKGEPKTPAAPRRQSRKDKH